MKTFSDIYTAVMNQVKIPTTDTDALQACKDSINSRYNMIAYRKKWPWKMADYDITVPIKMTTGTASVVAGSREATFAGATLTAAQDGWFVKFSSGDEIYKIVDVNVGTQVANLSAVYAGTTNATATFIVFKFQHGLPPDADELDSVWHEHMRYQVDILTPRDFLDRQVLNPYYEGKAEACCVSGFKAYEGPALGSFVLGYDFLNDTTENNLKLMTYPIIPDARYTLHVRYSRKITELSADADEPYIPQEKRQVLWFGALSDMFMRDRNNEAAAYYDRKFESELARMEADMVITDDRPKIKMDLRKYYRQSFYNRMSRRDRFDYD